MTEAAAADALLGSPLTVNIPAPRLLRLLGRRSVRYPVPIPVAETLIRMSRLMAGIGTDVGKLRAGELGDTLQAIARDGRLASRVIATGMLRPGWSQRLLTRPLARYLRRHMTMPQLAELTQVIVLLTRPEAFIHTIESVLTMNMMTPTSQEGNGS